MPTSLPNTNDAPPAKRRGWAFWVKLALVTLILAFIVKTVRDERAKFEQSDFSLARIQWQWLLLAGLSYASGMCFMGLNWYRLLRAMQQPVPCWQAVRAHYISQLGKYVPGKAIVLAVRLGLLQRYRVNAAATLVSIVAETLSMMSAGAVIAAVIIAITYRSKPEIALAAAGMAAVAGLPVIPPVLRWGLALLQRMRKRGNATTDGDDGVADSQAAGSQSLGDQLTWRALLPGWLGLLPGWLLMGLSMWAVMKSMNVAETRDLTLFDLPWVLASYAISVVAGFLSMLPGGFLVRETVMKELIQPTYGPVVALLAPVLHRMTSLTTELLICGILYLWPNSAGADESSSGER